MEHLGIGTENTYSVFINELKIFPQRNDILTNAHRIGVFSRHSDREKHTG